MAVVEDIGELSFVVVAGTRAHVKRRPSAPVVRRSEAAWPPKG